MADVYHKSITTTQGIHIFYAYTAADASARAALSLTSADEGKVVWQTDNDTFWAITSTGPNTFTQLDASGALLADGSVDLTADMDASSGVVVNDALSAGWDGSLLENPSVSVTSDGATITLSLEQSGGGDLTCRFGAASYVLDCTPAATVTLTAGSDTSPQKNYVYLTESGGTVTLAKSTSGWPSGSGFCAIAIVLCQSAASLQTDGAHMVQLWANHVDGTENGHIAHISRWVRDQPATWLSGVAPADLSVSDPDAYISTGSGVALQLHEQTMPARDMSTGDPLWLVNDPTTAYKRITTFDDITQDASGGAINNKYFPLVVWACVSEAQADCKLFANLPTGTYSNGADALADASGYAVYSIPDEFRGCGFLVANYVLQGKDSGAWSQYSKVDLRGQFPSLVAGGGGSGGGGDGDERVKVSSNDTTADYLFNQLAAGTGIAIAETNDGGDESVTITCDATAAEISFTPYSGVGDLTVQAAMQTVIDDVETLEAADALAMVSSNDTTPGYLNGKLVAGTNITLSEGNDGGNETLTISASGGGSNDQVAVSANDTTPSYLLSKLAAGTGITLTETNDGGDEDVTIGCDVTAAEVSYSNLTSGLAASNVNDAIDELESEKLALTGGTMTGSVVYSSSSGISGLTHLGMPEATSEGALPTAGTHTGNIHLVQEDIGPGTDTHLQLFAKGTLSETDAWKRVAPEYDWGGNIVNDVKFDHDGTFSLPTAAATSPASGNLINNSGTIERYDGASWVKAVPRLYTVQASARFGISDANWIGPSGIYPIEQDAVWEASFGAANIFTTPADPSAMPNSSWGMPVQRDGAIVSVSLMFDNLSATTVDELWFCLIKTSHVHGGTGSDPGVASAFPVGKQLCLDNTTDGLDGTVRQFFVSTDSGSGRQLTLGSGTDIEVTHGDSLIPVFAINYDASGSISNTAAVFVQVVMEEA